MKNLFLKISYMAQEKYKISESLKKMIEELTPKMKEKVGEVLSHHIGQYEKLKKNYPDEPESIAYNMHNIVDELLQKKRESIKDHKVSCSKGCFFCCFQQVDITDDEAKLLLMYANEKKLDIDYDLLRRQREAESEGKRQDLPIKDKKCVFLQDNGSCGVYDHRPTACRKLMVVSDPKDCNIESNPNGQIAKLADLESELMSTASHRVCESGTISEMLLKVKKEDEN